MDFSYTRRQFLQWSTVLAARTAFVHGQAAAQVKTLVGTGARGAATDGDAADHTQLNNPFHIVIGPDGAMYFSDFGTSRVFRLDFRTSKLSLVAGNGMKGFSGDGGPATKALLNQPHGVTLDRFDNLYICDPLNNRLRRVDAKTGTITTFAGNGESGHAPDEGSLTGIPLPGPRSLEITRDGKWYLALREGNSIFLLDATKNRVKRVAGTGENGYSGDGGSALAARFGSLGTGGLTGPKGLSVSSDGKTMYVADCENHVIRKIDLRTGIISTVMGTGQRGDGPDGDPLQCKLSRPHAVLIHDRTLYVADSENNRIRVLEPA